MPLFTGVFSTDRGRIPRAPLLPSRWCPRLGSARTPSAASPGERTAQRRWSATGPCRGYQWRPPLPLHQALVQRHDGHAVEEGAFFKPSSKKSAQYFDVVLIESDALRTLFP